MRSSRALGMSPIATCAMRKQVSRAIERLLRTLALAELSVVCIHESWHHERCTNKVVVRGSGDSFGTCEGNVGSLIAELGICLRTADNDTGPER
jgi:hypothetical protein